MIENPFSDFIAEIINKHGEENWVTVYKTIPNNGGDSDGTMYCALVSLDRAKETFDKGHCWDLTIGSIDPGFLSVYESGVEIPKYYANTDKEGYLRLILKREFHNRKENYIEILEEFRLFHNLYYDQNTSNYVAFDDTGDEVDIIRMEQQKIQIKRSYLKSFMAAKQMHLLLFFDLTKHFKKKVHFSGDESNLTLIYTIYSNQFSYSSGYESHSRIMGKKLILCGKVEESKV